MEDCKFKQLIIDVYKEWENPERTFTKDLGFMGTATYNNFFGVIYGAISRVSFDDITDIQGYMDLCNPNMLMLKSRVTDQELEIYDWELEDYNIQNNNLMIQLKSKEIVFQL